MPFWCCLNSPRNQLMKVSKHFDVTTSNGPNVHICDFIRIERSRSAISNVRRNQTVCGEIGKNFIYTSRNIVTDLLRVPKGDILLLGLFHFGIGKWCICLAVCNVVSVQPICSKNRRTFCINLWICVWSIRRLPFDWRNPYGYLAAVLIQYVVGLYLFLFATCVLPTTLGAYMLARTFAKDLMICISSINDRVQINENKVEIIKQHSKMLKIHSFLLELSWDTILY